MEDQTLECQDCGVYFVFTAGEAQFFRDRGFTDGNGDVRPPRRCVPCRRAVKLIKQQERATAARW